MRKTKALLIIFILSILSSYSQELVKQKCYRYENGECIPKLEIFKNSDKTYLIKEYNRDGSLSMVIENNSSSKPTKINGYVKFYSKKGVIESEGTYRNNRICCDWKVYDKNGKLERELTYNNLYDRDDSSDENVVFEKKDPTYECMPTFQGENSDAFRKYIQEELFYSPLMQRNGIEGKLFVQFDIDTTGKIINAFVVKKLDPDFDKEAMRVILNAPRWSPGYQKGEPVMVRFTMPFVFVLN